MIQIEKVENGFIVNWDGEKKMVFQDKDDGKNVEIINQFLFDLQVDDPKIAGMPFWAEIQRFKDTGKYYDSFVMNFVTDSYQDAVDIIREHHGHSSTNQSNFDYYLSNKGNLKHLHPKLITGKLAEYES